MTRPITRTAPTAPPCSNSRAWLGPAVALVVLGWGANQFAPLIVLYRQRLDLSAGTLNGIFGLYALGLVPALLVGGRLSDRVGRKPLVVIGLVGTMIATVVLICGSDDATILAIGRLLSGTASGLVFGTGTAWIKELSERSDDATAGPRRATVAMTFGFSAGPVFAGLCAQWLPWPTTLPYLPHLVLSLIALPAILRTPDPVRDIGERPADDRTAAHRRDRSTATHLALVVAPFAPWVFGTAAIGLAYLPSLVTEQVAGHAMAFSAVAIGTTALTGILVQPVVRRMHRGDSRRLLLVSMIVVVAAVGCAAWAASQRQPAIVVLASALLGIVYGFTQFSGLAEVQAIADSRSLGTITSLYQVLSYIGFGLPFVLSIAQEQTGLSPSTLLLITGCVAFAVWAWLVLATLPRTSASRAD